jgi:4-hydroxy-2-oxoheptanedioate aldolase
MKNQLKAKMANGECVFGTWCMLPSSFTVDAIARSGIDFVVIDMEHGTMGYDTAEDMVRAAAALGCEPIIRVGTSEPNTILHALETGISNVLVPHVKTAVQAKGIADATRYFPDGDRGLSPYTRNHGYTHEGLAESMQQRNDEMCTGILVEGQEGISNLPEIAKINGIDLIYLGLYDISQSVGFPGELENPVVIKAIADCLQAIKDAGKFAGTFSREIEACRNFSSQGFDFVAYLADSYGLRQFFAEANDAFRV